MFGTSGNGELLPFQLNQSNLTSFQSVDDNYLVIGNHVDAATKQKICNHEYVDFAKLLPRNRINRDEDHRMELVMKGNSTYFIPVSDREGSIISSFGKWEQAFRVFSNLYSRFHPSKATELIQYNHVIYTVSTTYVWDNVYTYDKEFRMHISNFPSRSWAVILQQAWSMYLKDRFVTDDHSKFNQNRNKSKEICKCFNRGKCPNGLSCRYEHRCSVEGHGKFGHGAHNCRKRLNRESGGNSNPVQETKAN